MIKRIFCVSAAFLFLAGFWQVSATAGDLQEPAPDGCNPHAAIHITANGDFAVGTNGVVSGSGNPGDPYIIEKWDISASGARGIWIENTDVHFVIRHSIIHGGKPGTNNGIQFNNVVNGAVLYNNISYNQYGVYLSGSSGCTIHHNNFIANVKQAYDDGSNDWDSGYPGGGNWWSDASGQVNISANITTNLGSIVFALRPDKAPITSFNFVQYAGAKFFDGLIFHRTIDNFMIQGGGMYRSGGSLTDKPAIFSPIPLETSPDLKHLDGAVSMARTSDPNSATSQFFICDGAQSFLDGNYAVFGYVYQGMDVVRAIAAAPTHSEGGYDNVPNTDVVIQNVTLAINALAVDQFSGANQDVPGSDGIVDTPVPIEGGSDTDRYPLVSPSTWPGTVPDAAVLLALPAFVLLAVLAIPCYRRKKDCTA